MLYLPDKYRETWDNFPVVPNVLKVELCQFLLDTEQTHYNEFIERYCNYFLEEDFVIMCQSNKCHTGRGIWG